jgi:hypothetical protein
VLHGWISLTQAKNRKRKPVTLSVPMLPEVEAILAVSPSSSRN